MTELWQLYDEQGRPLAGKGATKDEIRKGLLHAASHVWAWRKHEGRIEVLLQKRAEGKPTWPGRYDISAAGHIDLGEDSLMAAVRETSEEIGLNIAPENLRFCGVFRCYMVEEQSGIIENEYQWLYTFEVKEGTEYELQTDEVASVEWKTLEAFRQEASENPRTHKYVPHEPAYFAQIVLAIERHASAGRP